MAGEYQAYKIIYVWTVRAFVKFLIVYLVETAAPLVSGATISYIDGDDAWWDQEIPFPVGWPRFDEIHPNVQYDRYTGLEWIADPSELGGIWGVEGFPEQMTWTDALAACNALNYAGHSDWRMPNSKELDSITDFSKAHPAINEQRFKNTKDDNYFSSSTTNYGCENYFRNDASTGGKTWDPNRDKKGYIRPVRGKLVPWWGKGPKWLWKY